MKFFPTVIVDDFFRDPDKVLELAKSVEYRESARTTYPGVVSKKLVHEIEPDLFDYTIQRVLSLFWDLKDSEVKTFVKMQFQKVTPYIDKEHFLNKGLIHHDYGSKSIATFVVYLNETSTKDSGTSFYEVIDPYYASVNQEYLQATKDYHSGKDVPELESLIKTHRSKFEETLRVPYKRNRMVLFSSDTWHSQTTYGDQTRYILRCFVYTLHPRNNKNKSLLFPLMRHTL